MPDRAEVRDVTLAKLRRDGWLAQSVEKFNPHQRGWRDLFGCIDIVAIRGDSPGVLGIQACVRESLSARTKKILGDPRMQKWVLAGNQIAVWAWKRLDPLPGRIRGRWRLTRRDLTLEVLAGRKTAWERSQEEPSKLPRVA